MSARQGYRRRDPNASDAVAALLRPQENNRQRQRRKGVPVKDFEKLNKMYVKKLQAKNREQRQLDEAPLPESFKLTRFKRVQPKLQSDDGWSPDEKKSFLKRSELVSDPPPTARTTKPRMPPYPPPVHKPHTKARVPSVDELSERNRKRLESMHLKEKKDYISVNAWDVIRHSPPKSDISSTSSYHSNFGRVPEYLIKRKEAWAKEEEERQQNLPDPECPKGMKRLEEDERQRTVSVLHTSLNETRDRLNHMPISARSVRTEKKKEALETKLREIESALRVFERPKVFVPLTQNRAGAAA